MAHAAPTSHRRGTRASHRSGRIAGPIQPTTWLGLTFALIFGLVLTARTHPGLHAAGLTLLAMLLPLTLAVATTARRHGHGSTPAALSTALAFALTILHFLF